VVTPCLLSGVLRAVRWADALGRSVPGERQADGAALLAREAVRGAAGLAGRAAGQRTVLGGAGLLGGSGWLAGPVGSSGPRGPRGYRARGFASSARNGAAVHIPRTPRLRQATARPGDGWLGGGPRTRLAGPAQRRPGRPPRLRPAAGVPGSAAARPPRTLPRSSANLRISAPRRRGGSVGRAAGAGLAASARRGTGPPGSAFRSRRPEVGAAAGRPRAAASARAPRFRPDTRLRGGSSSPKMLPAGTLRGAARRGKAMRGAALRTRAMRGGALSTRAMRGAALRTRAMRGAALSRSRRMRPARGATLRLRSGTRRGLAVRSPSLRLRSGRRGDGTLGGGVLTSRGLWPRSRKAAPRFRSRPATGGRSLLSGRARVGVSKPSRFSPGRTSLWASLTRGRLGGRSTVWRIGSRRTGGLR